MLYISGQPDGIFRKGGALTPEVSEESFGVTVVIPAINEAGNIVAVLDDFSAVAQKVLPVLGPSGDDLHAIVERYGLKAIKDNGEGKGAAIQKAIMSVDTPIIVFADADCSHRAEDIPALIAPIRENKADFVIGSRVRGGSDEWGGGLEDTLRLVGNILITSLINLRFHVRLTDTLSGYRAIRTTCARDLNLREKYHTIEHEMVIKALRAGYRVAETPCHEYRRLHGRSTLSFRRQWIRFIYSAVRYLVFP